MDPTSMAAPLVKPEIVSFDELLDDARNGRIVVPRFQRPYVWKPKDISKLFESILEGYPIGSLFLWETQEDIERSDIIGAISVPETSTAVRRYILDGHQRLATLMSVLTLPTDYPRGPELEHWRWWLCYDLSNDEFVHLKPTDSIEQQHLPLRSVLKTSEFLKEARRIEEKWLDKADQLARAVRDYRIPLTVMRRGSLSQAVEVFSRLNSRGVDLSRDEMASALTYRTDGPRFHLADAITNIEDRLTALGYGETRRKTIFLAIGAAAGIDFQRTEIDGILRQEGNSDKLPKAAEEAGRGLERAVSFLLEEVGLPTDRLLPYSNQLLLLSHFFRISDHADAGQSALLVKWFWATSLNGWFAGANTTDINNGLKAMADLAAGQTDGIEDHIKSQPIRPFPRTFDLRSARIRASLLIQLKISKPLRIDGDAIGQPIDGVTVFNDKALRNLPYVFTTAKLNAVSSPGNRLIAFRPKPMSVRQALQNAIQENRTNILSSLSITPDAAKALLQNKPDAFIAAREAELDRVEQGFISELGLTFDRSAPRDDLGIDTE